MDGERCRDAVGEGIVVVAAPEVAPEVAVVGLSVVAVLVTAIVVKQPFVDDLLLFLGGIFCVFTFQPVLHQFDRSKPKGLLSAGTHGNPLAQLGNGRSGGDGGEVLQGVVGVVDEACAAVAAGAPGEVFEPVAVLVFWSRLAGAEARPGVTAAGQAGGEGGVVAEVKGVFFEAGPGVEAGAGEQAVLALAVGGEGLFELDGAADAARPGGQAGKLCRRVRLVLFERGDDEALGLVLFERGQRERFARGERGLRGGVGDVVRAGVGTRRFLGVADELAEGQGFGGAVGGDGGRDGKGEEGTGGQVVAARRFFTPSPTLPRCAGEGDGLGGRLLCGGGFSSGGLRANPNPGPSPTGGGGNIGSCRWRRLYVVAARRFFTPSPALPRCAGEGDGLGGRLLCGGAFGSGGVRANPTPDPSPTGGGGNIGGGFGRCAKAHSMVFGGRERLGG